MASTARKRNLCVSCNTRTVGSGGKRFDTQSAASVDNCGPCYELAGYENQHSDSGHDFIKNTDRKDRTLEDQRVWEEEMAHCWVCHPELNEAAKEHKARTSKGGKAGTQQKARKPQLNHRTQCTHPQTPEARRECRKAYWANINKEVTVTPEPAADRSNQVIEAAKIEAPVIRAPKANRYARQEAELNSKSAKRTKKA